MLFPIEPAKVSNYNDSAQFALDDSLNPNKTINSIRKKKKEIPLKLPGLNNTMKPSDIKGPPLTSSNMVTQSSTNESKLKQNPKG